MNKIKINFKGRANEFTYYQSWMDTGHHIFCIITENKEATRILQLGHFFIDIDIMGSGQYYINIIENTPEEVAFKKVIADEVLAQHYHTKQSTHLN
jgi:hypothetical protein